jgi:hypothetical protein
MPTLKVLQSSGDALRRTLLLWLLPRLAEVPIHRWHPVLQQARDIDFDGFERIGLVAGVAFAAYLLDSPAPDSVPLASFIHYVVVFFQALVLLAVVAGPLYLRCTRRGLANVLSGNRQAMTKESGNDPGNG